MCIGSATMNDHPVVTAGLHYTLAPLAMVAPYITYVPTAVSVAVGVVAFVFYILQIIDWIEKRKRK